MAYDLLAQKKTGDFLKCQVKTTDKLQTVKGNNYWMFNTGKTSKVKEYSVSEIDFFALVVLPKRVVSFVLPNEAKSTFSIREDKATSQYEEQTLRDVLGIYL